MQTHQTDFSNGNVYRNIMEVAVPMIIAQILNLLYNIVDRIYIGRIPEIGATALTGVGLCFPIITLITAFTYLFGNGGSPLCSMERGRGNEKEAEMLMGRSEEHTSELQSPYVISYAVFCLKKRFFCTK